MQTQQTKRFNKSAVIRGLLNNPNLSTKQIAKMAKSNEAMVYTIRSVEKKKKERLALQAKAKKVIPSVVSQKTVKPINKVENVNTDSVNLDANINSEVLAFISQANLNFNLGSAVALIANVNKSQTPIKDIMMATRHLAFEVSRYTKK